VLALSRLLLANGVKHISLVCTHGVFTGDAIQRLQAVPEIDEIVTTDTVPIPADKRLPCMKVLSVAPVFAAAIRRNFNQQSIGDLFTFA
jgi:ribose-phosphate pyrophosphokinase